MAGERELPDISRIQRHPSGALLIPDSMPSTLPADPTPADPPEHPNPAIAELLAVRDEFVAAARRASKAQVDLWRQIPWLALQADGRTGHLDQYADAFYSGYWVFNQGPNTSWSGASVNTGVCVDLETGELMGSYSALDSDWGNKPPVPASAEGILRILAVPEQLDAESIVERLKKKAEQPTGSYYNEEEKRQWRERIVAEQGLTPMFSRRKVVTPDPPAIEP